MPRIADVDLSLTDGLLLVLLVPLCLYLAYQLYHGRRHGAPGSPWLMGLRIAGEARPVRTVPSCS